MAKPPITVTRISSAGDFLARIKGIGQLATYVGIPGSSDRMEDASKRANKFTSLRKRNRRLRKRLKRIAAGSATNAELLYWFSKGSPLRNQPPRLVLEAAIHAPGNKEKISALVAESSLQYAKGQIYRSKQTLKQAGALSAKICRQWFFDPRNGWAPNNYNTVRKKGSEQPGIDTNEMRMAITHVEKEIT
jgi:hypothetical protein